MTKRKQKDLFPVKIIDNQEIVPGVFSLETEKKFDFIPGQVVAVAMNPTDEPRLYSIASGNKKDFIRLIFDVNPHGKLTPQLAKLSKGNKLYMSKPFGKFLGTVEPAWWIATGTGIAPFISMAESDMYVGKKLIHGAKTPAEFLFSELFVQTLGESYLRFATREVGPGINSGRLTSWLKDLKELPGDVLFYLCGNPDMVVEVRDILVGKGIAIEKVIAEIYF